jgi:hypothetical protein
MVSDEAFNSWEEFLNPDKLKLKLIQASIYISSFEILKSSTIRKIKGFFADVSTIRFDGDEIQMEESKRYKKEVRSLHPKDEFHSCCLWLSKMNAISDSDLNEISELRKYRNYVAHELEKIITSKKHSIKYNKLEKVYYMQKKIDIWWFKEIEAGIDPDLHNNFDNDSDWEKVIGGNTLVIDLLKSIFNGNDKQLRELYTKFVKLWNERN